MDHFRKYDQPRQYDIRVRGSIDPQWADWFDGLTIQSLGEGETLLTRLITDQAALYGMLAMITKLRVVLLSLKQVEVFQKL